MPKPQLTLPTMVPTPSMSTLRNTLGALFLTGTVLLSSVLTGCASPQERVDAVPLHDFLVSESELPEGFSASPITGTELANGTEGNLASFPDSCTEPSKVWAQGTAERVGTFLEYPAANVVVALLLFRPTKDFTVVDDYLRNCHKHFRQDDGLRLKVILTDFPVPTTAAVTTRGYREKIIVPRSRPVSSTYLYGTHSGISVIAILRSRYPYPSEAQISSLNRIFQGQIEKIDGAH